MAHRKNNSLVGRYRVVSGRALRPGLSGKGLGGGCLWEVPGSSPNGDKKKGINYKIKKW